VRSADHSDHQNPDDVPAIGSRMVNVYGSFFLPILLTVEKT
jgi:hypothetical protein